METIVRLPGVKARTGKSRSAIYEGVSRGEFPRPISLGSRSVGWLESEISAWIAERVEHSRCSEHPREVGLDTISAHAEYTASTLNRFKGPKARP